MKRYRIYDTLRTYSCNSITHAWQRYDPLVSRIGFWKRLVRGYYPYLKFSVINEVPNRKEIVDVNTGEHWKSISACARDLKVSKTAVQNALKRKRPCKGHQLQITNKDCNIW